MKSLPLALLFISTVSAAWNPLVKNDPRLDRFISQVSARYDVAFPDGFTHKPMHREPIAAFIQLAVDSLNLTANEREDALLLAKIYSGERALLKRSTENARINLNLNLTGDVSVGSDDSLEYGLKGIINPAISGNLAGLSFASEFSMWTEKRNDTIWGVSTYEPIDGNPYNLFGRADSGSVRASDMFRGGVSLERGPILLDCGVDHIKLGPTVRNPLFINLAHSPAAFARFTLDFPWFDYSHGMIKLQSLRDYKRFMMYHRYEIPLFKKRLRVGFNESVVYGSSADSATEAKYSPDPMKESYYENERPFEPVYLIPFLPFVFMEHFSGDRENKQLSLDASLSLPRNVVWNAEFMLDDISNPATLFSEDWGNKWAFAFGGQWFTAIAQKNVTRSAEYSRIEPWVYTHFRGTSHRYDHFGSPIGSDLGPNTDLFWAETELQLNQKNRFSLALENYRWNRDQRGGTITDHFIDGQVLDESKDSADVPTIEEDVEVKEFLAGDVQSNTAVVLKWSFLPYHRYEMDTKVSYSSENGVCLSLHGGFRF